MRLDQGTTLSPWTLLTGEPAFVQGTAIITPNEAGELSWSRVTGKVARVYVATIDGAVRSNRVIIR